MDKLSAKGWSTLLCTALPTGMGIGILALDSALLGVVVGWALVAAFLIGEGLLFRSLPFTIFAVVVAAAGVPSIVTPDMVRPGAIVVSGGQSWAGRRALPDVDESVAEVAGWITPRLGGVGPTTVAMLLRNTVTAAEAAAGGGKG